MKKTLKIIGFTLLGIVALAAIFFGIIVLTEYKPEDIEPLKLSSSDKILDHRDLTLLTWNTGYAGLDESSNFFMDGGTDVNPASKAIVLENMEGINKTLSELKADFYLLQEVDLSSSRTRYIDQTGYYLDKLTSRVYSPNFKTLWIPYPLPMMGKMNSGIMTISDYAITSAERIKLPCPFTWPVSMFNLKRCLEICHIPIEDSSNELVLINLHLEAFDSGEGKIAQTRVLMDILESEYAKGNYVIAGGDFNQRFPNTLEAYPQTPDENVWTPGTLEASSLPDDWQYVCDASNPSCRSLDKALTDASNHQFYLIDGFILSPNIELNSINTLQYDFRYTDHNPVIVKIILK